MRIRKLPCRILPALLLLQAVATAAIERPVNGPYFEDDRMLVELIPRTPSQMAAFYEARGFPRAALERIRRTCFMTLHIENRSRDVLWVDLGRWHFYADGREIPRLGEHYWQQQWDDIQLRQASRSTFGWTQFPQLRDLQPEEPVGGNLVFPGNTRRINIDAELQAGADRTGPVIHLGFGNVPCAQDDAAP
jgi:hypothetical protein